MGKGMPDAPSLGAGGWWAPEKEGGAAPEVGTAVVMGIGGIQTSLTSTTTQHSAGMSTSSSAFRQLRGPMAEAVTAGEEGRERGGGARRAEAVQLGRGWRRRLVSEPCVGGGALRGREGEIGRAHV